MSYLRYRRFSPWLGRSYIRYPSRTCDVTYDIVGVTYDVVVTDLRYRRWPTTLYVARIQMDQDRGKRKTWTWNLTSENWGTIISHYFYFAILYVLWHYYFPLWHYYITYFFANVQTIIFHYFIISKRTIISLMTLYYFTYFYPHIFLLLLQLSHYYLHYFYIKL